MIDKYDPAMWPDDPEMDAWLARQKRPGGIIIQATPPTYWERWRHAPISHVVSAIIMAGLILPFLILFCGILLLGLWDYITGQ